jgi:hypothetical protein
MLEAEAVVEAVLLALKFESSPSCWYNSLKFDLMSEADVGAGTGGEFEVIVGLGRSRKLRPPLPPYLAALLAPEVPVLDEEEDILEAMVSLGDEIGLNVEWPPRPVVGDGVDTVEVVGLPYLEEIGLRLG